MHPPVDTGFYTPDAARTPEPFFLAVSALVPYKRLDLAIRAVARVGGALTVVGRGPEEARLRGLAESIGANVTFAGWRSDDEIRDLYRRSRAVLMPGVEDFGMVPVEAQACGRPVVALGEGGALDSVVDGETGILVKDASVDAFADALNEAARRSFDPAVIRRHAESFGKARFQSEFRAVVDSVCRPSEQGPGEIDRERTMNPTDESHAARFAQRPRSLAGRENKR